MTGPAGAAVSPRRVALRRLFGSLAAGFGVAFGRFPAAILAIAGLSILANLEVAGSPLVEHLDASHLAMALLVAVNLSIAATLAVEARGGATGLRLLGGMVAALTSGATVWFVREPHLFAPPLLAASILAVFLAPNAAPSDSLRCWTFAFWTLLGCLLGFASILLFVVGGSAIVEMVRYLFGIGLRPGIYKHVYVTAVSFVGPVFALGRIPQDFTEAADERHPDRLLVGLKVLADWLAAPLILIAAVLLHAYAVKLAVAGNLPANELGWIVSTYVVIVLSQRILVEPFRVQGGLATALFRRLWAWLLVVPLLLLAAAIWFRVAGEGWTAPRYFLALLCVCSGLIVVLQLIPKLRSDARLIVAVFAVVLTISSFGPAGVSQTVGRSQSALIRQEFTNAAGLIRTANLAPGEDWRLRSRIDALAEVGALTALAPMLPGDAASLRPDWWESSSSVLDALALNPQSQMPTRTGFSADATAPFDVAGFDTVYGAVTERTSPAGAISAAIEGGNLRLTVNSVRDLVPLGDLADRLEAVASSGGTVAPLTVDRTTAAGKTVRLRILSASIEGTEIRDITFDAAIRRAEWSR